MSFHMKDDLEKTAEELASIMVEHLSKVTQERDEWNEECAIALKQRNRLRASLDLLKAGLDLLKAELEAAVDGGVECRGRDAQLTGWIRMIEEMGK